MTRDELSGSPVAFGEAVAVEPEPEPEPEPTPTVGGGGGGGPEITRVTLTGIIAWPSLRIDPLGIVQSTCSLTSSDGNLTLDITEGTVILDSAGDPLTYLSTSRNRFPPKAAEGKIVIAAYNLSPDGANFDPAITLTLKYDEVDLPEDCAEKDFYIAYWDGEKYCGIASVCDAAKDTVCCQVSHFTVFAIIATIMPAAPAPAAFTISELSVGPAQVQPKEAVTIIASVANTGSTEGTYSVVLKINGVKEAEKSVIIAAGGSQDVSFSVAREELGTYAVVVDGLSGSFTVVAVPAPVPAPPPAPPPVERINWPLLGGIIAAVIVGVVLIILLVRRKKAY